MAAGLRKLANDRVVLSQRVAFGGTPRINRFARTYIAVIVFVGEQPFGFGQRQRHQVLDRAVIRCLTTGQDEAERTSLIVTAGVDFARKAAA